MVSWQQVLLVNSIVLAQSALTSNVVVDFMGSGSEIRSLGLCLCRKTPHARLLHLRGGSSLGADPVEFVPPEAPSKDHRDEDNQPDVRPVLAFDEEEEKERKQYEYESAFSQLPEDPAEEMLEARLSGHLTDTALTDSEFSEPDEKYGVLRASSTTTPISQEHDPGKKNSKKRNAAGEPIVLQGAVEQDAGLHAETGELPEEPIPGPNYSTLKEALGNVTVHGTKLMLSQGQHGPFLVQHSYPQEHENDRIWPDQIEMDVPCSIIGEAGVHVEATLSVRCGTIGVGPCVIQMVSWIAHRASCIYIFGGVWNVRECEVRTDHPAGDAIYCRGTSRLPAPVKWARQPDEPARANRHVRFPLVVLEIDKSGLGGIRPGVPAGWGVLVCEKATLKLTNSRVEYTHQAVSVVDWCRAKVENCVLQHNGNALWFGNKCEVLLQSCFVNDTVTAFCLRTMWDRGTECCNRDQDNDDGRNAQLTLKNCTIRSPVAFEGGRTPGTFVNQSSTFTVPEVKVNASHFRPGLPYIKDPYTYHMKNLHRDDMSGIKTFGADPQLMQRNPDYVPPTETAFVRQNPYAASRDEIRKGKDASPLPFSV